MAQRICGPSARKKRRAKGTQDQLRKPTKERGALKPHANGTAKIGPEPGWRGEDVCKELLDRASLVRTEQQWPAERIRPSPAEHLSGDSNAERHHQRSYQRARGFGGCDDRQEPRSRGHRRRRKRTSRNPKWPA